MSFTAIPRIRLMHCELGEVIQLKGDGSEAEYKVESIRPDGYIQLTHNTRRPVTASRCHEVIKK